MNFIAKHKNIIIFLAVLVFLAFGVAIFMNFTTMSEVETEGLTAYERKEFLKKTGYNDSFGNTYIYYFKNKFKDHPEIAFIEKYEVTIVNKNKVMITVYENDILGAVKVMSNYFYFNREGVIIATSVDRKKDVPLVKGLEFTEVVVHEPLKTQKNTIFESIMEISNLLTKYSIQVSEIIYDDNNNISLVSGNLIIIMGTKATYERQLGAIAEIYERAALTGGTIDLRNYSETNTTIILK